MKVEIKDDRHLKEADVKAQVKNVNAGVPMEEKSDVEEAEQTFA
jgi:copper chaperone CopZ